MKEITLPELTGVDDHGKTFGLAEYMTDVLFTRPDLLQDVDFCEMVVELMAPLRKLSGPEHVGKKFQLTDEHHKLLLGCNWSNPRVIHHAPEAALAIAHFRIAVKKAETVKEKKPAAESNGATATEETKPAN